LTTIKLLIILACEACGRVDFDPLAGDGGSLHAPPDAAPGAVQSRIAHVGTFATHKAGVGAVDSFPGQAHAASNVVLLQVSCAATTAPTSVSVNAPGWSFTLLGALTSSTSSTQNSATFAAIAPDANPTTVTVTWLGGSSCDVSKNDIGDEFAMTDPAGGTVTVDSSNTVASTGDCVGDVTTGHDSDAVWAACNTAGKIIAAGKGFSPGTDDGAGDLSEFRITSDLAGIVEHVQFPNTAPYVLSMVTLKPE
jgi:hypothetical protein